MSSFLTHSRAFDEEPAMGRGICDQREAGQVPRGQRNPVTVLQTVPSQHGPRTHLAAVQGHGEVGVLRFARPREHRRDRLSHQLHLGHVAAAPSQVQLGHGGTLAGGDTPVLMEFDQSRVEKERGG